MIFFLASVVHVNFENKTDSTSPLQSTDKGGTNHAPVAPFFDRVIFKKYKENPSHGTEAPRDGVTSMENGTHHTPVKYIVYVTPPPNVITLHACLNTNALLTTLISIRPLISREMMMRSSSHLRGVDEEIGGGG